jgi:isocitrate/isopropylmalate dehydrogenase
MLEDIGELEASRKIERAVAAVLAEGKKVTKDINPVNYVSTDEMTDAILNKLDSK